MPIVTDIKRQKRSEQRYNIYLDGAYSFALSDLDLSTSGLRIGQSLSTDRAEELQKQSGVERFYNLALRFLSYRPRSRREMVDYLGRKEVDGEAVEPIVERLERLGLVDDAAFAASWIANRQTLRPRSKRRMEQELLQKGLSRDDVQIALGEMGDEVEYQALLQLAERKSQLSQYRDESKLIAFLARQGYPYELIKRVLQEMTSL